MEDFPETHFNHPPRALLVEDDELFAAGVVEIIRPLGSVDWVASAEQALALLGTADWDLFILDVNLPGMSGLELAERVKRSCPHAAILILTANVSLDTAVGALRVHADDFLTKPVEAPALIAKARELISAARKRKEERSEVVLAIGAHPDDVEIGCGAILLRHNAFGDRVSILTLTGGEAGGRPTERIAESRRAAGLIGARLFQSNLADTSLSVSDGGIMIGTIERVIAEIGPAVVYTHSGHDVHQDHRNVHDATLVAARKVPRLYCYQAPSGSIDFRPTRFVEIDQWVERKLEVIGAYSSQVKIRAYLQEDLLRATARYWSRFGSSSYAEPLEVVRDNEAPPRRSGSTVPDAHETGIEADITVSDPRAAGAGCAAAVDALAAKSRSHAD